MGKEFIILLLNLSLFMGLCSWATIFKVFQVVIVVAVFSFPTRLLEGASLDMTLEHKGDRFGQYFLL